MEGRKKQPFEKVAAGGLFVWSLLLLTAGLFKGMGLVDQIAGEGHLSAAYLWASLASFLLVIFVITRVYKLALNKQLELEKVEALRVAESDAAESLRETALEDEYRLQAISAKLQHRLVEEVRRAAVGKFNWGSGDLSRCLGDALPRYLRKLLGSDKLPLRVTVKKADPEFVTAVFRCGAHEGTREIRDKVTWDQSVPMMRFTDAFDPKKAKQQQWVYIPDLEKEPVSIKYKEDLAKFEVRSILAFPLRDHAQKLAEGQMNSLLGFISIDCPEVDAFAQIFSDSNCQARCSLDVFFAIADALATIVVLEKRRSKVGK